MINSGELYKGLPAITYATDQGDKVMGWDILAVAAPDDLRKELQLYLSVDKIHRSWVTVTNVINLYTKLRTHSTIEQLTSLEMMSLKEIIKHHSPPDGRVRPSPEFEDLSQISPDARVFKKKRRFCVIL